jgi:membrane-associated phospholipid phosphatase
MSEGATGRHDGQLADNSADPGSRLFGLNPADKVVFSYLALIALLVLIFSFRIPSWGWLCAAHAVAISLVALISKLDRPLAASPARPVVSFCHGWYPVVLMCFTYKELTYLIPRLHPHDFDSTLAAIDYRMLGVNPTVWLERVTWPPLTEVLQLTYSTYYFLPIILGAVLWRNTDREKFHFWVFVVVLGFYLSYLGYIAVPAVGPRFLSSILEAQSKPLTGVWLFHSIRETLDNAEGFTRDCFPSGHTELTLLVLYYARKFHRRTFWWLLPFGIGIIVSTVYLRYHYVIDVIAGALIAVAIIIVAKPVYEKLRNASE